MAEQSLWRNIPADHPALPGHFPGNPIVPGVVLLSQVWETVCCQAGAPLHCTGWPSVKFLAPLQPGVPFRVEVEFGTTQSAKFVCKTATNTIAQGSVRFAATHPHPNLPLVSPWSPQSGGNLAGTLLAGEGEGTIALPPAGGKLEGGKA